MNFYSQKRLYAVTYPRELTFRSHLDCHVFMSNQMQICESNLLSNYWGKNTFYYFCSKIDKLFSVKRVAMRQPRGISYDGIANHLNAIYWGLFLYGKRVSKQMKFKFRVIFFFLIILLWLLKQSVLLIIFVACFVEIALGNANIFKIFSIVLECNHWWHHLICLKKDRCKRLYSK